MLRTPFDHPLTIRTPPEPTVCAGVVQVGAVSGSAGGSRQDRAHVTSVLEVASVRHAVVTRRVALAPSQADGGCDSAVQLLVASSQIFAPFKRNYIYPDKCVNAIPIKYYDYKNGKWKKAKFQVCWGA